MLLCSVPKLASLSLIALVLLSPKKDCTITVHAKKPPPVVSSVGIQLADDPPGQGIVIGGDPAGVPGAQEPAVLQQCPLNGNQKFVQVCIDSSMTITKSHSNTSRNIPPDPHGTAGPKSLIAVTNARIECLRKDNAATVFGPTYLMDMFDPLSPSSLFDPKIRYDVHKKRFVMVALDMATNETGWIVDTNIMVAVSKTDDPLSASSNDWYMTKINSVVNGSWADYPGFAVDEEAIYITCNMFSIAGDNFDKSLMWIIKKEEFYAGNSAVWKMHDYVSQINAAEGKVVAYYDNFMPAMVRAPAGVPNSVGTYLFSYGGWTDNGIESVQFIEISNPVTNPTFRYALVPLGNIDTADDTYTLPGAPQPGSNFLLDAGDQRSLDAVWVDNYFWGVFAIQDMANETAAYWIKIVADGGKTWPPTVADQGRIDGEDIGQGTYTYYPSIDVNSKGVVAFGFAASSASSIYAGAYATIRDDINGDPGTTFKADLVRAGQKPYYIKFGGARNRWGDYTSVALDPSNENCFWTFNEYAGDFNTSGYLGSWKTAWAKFCYPANPWTSRCSKKGSKCLRSAKCCSGMCVSRKCA